MKECAIIYNPNSGHKEVNKYLEEIVKILDKEQYHAIIYATEYKKHATEIVRKLPPEIDLVMSFGGDGTFNEVMAGNLQRREQLLLTHIPVGTTNDIGAMLGYQKNILENVKKSLNGVVKEFDIGLINNKPFIYVAGFGKYMNISYDTSRELKKKIGQLAYYKEGIKEFFHKTKLYDVTYEIDKEKYRGLFSFILISNANHIAGLKNIYKDVKLDDDKFEIVLSTIKKKKDLLKSLYILTSSDPSKIPGIYFYKTNNIKIKINDEEYKDWCIDGEKLSKSEKNTYEIKTKNHIKILIPTKNVSKLFINK